MDSNTDIMHLKWNSKKSIILSRSETKLALKESPFQQFWNEDYKNSNEREDCFTQTSKTILQLAQLETEKMSPDSLSSHNNEELVSDTSNKTIYTLEGSVQESKSDYNIPYTSKNNVIENFENPEKNNYFQNLTETFLNKSQKRNYSKPISDQNSILLSVEPHSNQRSRFLQQSSPLQKLMEKNLKSQSYIENVSIPKSSNNDFFEGNRFQLKNLQLQSIEKTKPVKLYSNNIAPNIDQQIKNRLRSNSFMSPTISSENKNKGNTIHNFSRLISATRRGRSTSPKKLALTIDFTTTKQKVPYIDGSDASEVSAKTNSFHNKLSNYDSDTKLEQSPNYDEDLSLNLKSSREANLTLSASASNIEFNLSPALNKLRDKEWNISLKGLVEVVEICRVADTDLVFSNMTLINQRLIELLRSPRSHVCRTACQAAGHLFDYVKDTRRPEFDEIVDTLLAKTADSNKFIRHDANLALDCMVTQIPIMHAVRALSNKGPVHKNALVRTATSRLVVCAVVIAGTENILHNSNNEHTRKRIILNMAKFLEDKCLDTRKFGERLYKQLDQDVTFGVFLKKYLEKEDLLKLKKSLKFSKNK